MPRPRHSPDSGPSSSAIRLSALRPDHFHDVESSTAASSEFEHIPSKDISRQPTPFTVLPHPDAYRGEIEQEWDSDEEPRDFNERWDKGAGVSSLDDELGFTSL